jgi:hypothetical protein
MEENHGFAVCRFRSQHRRGHRGLLQYAQARWTVDAPPIRRARATGGNSPGSDPRSRFNRLRYGGLRRSVEAHTIRNCATGHNIFPAPTARGHIEPSSLKRQHRKVCRGAGLEHFPLYTLRHTCLTGWASHMDPRTLAYLAGHRDMSITKRYIHPQEHTTRAAMDRARDAQGAHKNGHSELDAPVANHGRPAVIS